MNCELCIMVGGDFDSAGQLANSLPDCSTQRERKLCGLLFFSTKFLMCVLSKITETDWINTEMLKTPCQLGFQVRLTSNSRLLDRF